MLKVTGEMGTLGRMWADALSCVVVRHPNPESKPSLELHGSDEKLMLIVSIGNHRDTGDMDHGMWSSFVISNVQLTYFPGVVLARQWITAAWAGYVQHEALELVTVDGKSPLNPHAQPYRTNPWNRGLRDGLPHMLTPDTLVKALAVTMPIADAYELVAAS